MADDEFAVAVGSAVRDALASGKLSSPISAMDVLLSLITSKAAAGCSSHLRLTDLHRLETVLESLSRRWENGSLSLSRENGVLMITDVHFGNALSDTVNPRKRKRPPVDEEADSAAEDDPDDRSSRSISHSPPPSASPLANLGKELREVYAILQRATAKGRLLAERVCSLTFNDASLCKHNHSLPVLHNAWELQPRLFLHHKRGLCQGTSRKCSG